MTAKTLLQDNDELIKALLPSQLLNISTIAEECKRLAESTEKKFTDVILFIQEILEACLNSKQCYEEERRYISLKLEEAKMKKESSEQATKLEKNNKELTEILVTMRSCEIKEIDFQTTLKMLVKGLDAMGRFESSINIKMYGLVVMMKPSPAQPSPAPSLSDCGAGAGMRQVFRAK
ncbi:UNVERIFIED_CONTAM: hypothetical protein FKN15_070074 [Acipenser sinensis]